MIDVQKIAAFARLLEKATDFLQRRGGLPSGAKIESMDWTPSGPVLHLDDGSHWKVRMTLERLDPPTREDYSS